MHFSYFGKTLGKISCRSEQQKYPKKEGHIDKNGKICVLRKTSFKVKIACLFIKDVIECDEICTQERTILLVVATAIKMRQHHRFGPHGSFELTPRQEIFSSVHADEPLLLLLVFETFFSGVCCPVMCQEQPDHEAGARQALPEHVQNWSALD